MEPEGSLPCLQLVLIPLVPTGTYSTDKASPSSLIFCQNVGFFQAFSHKQKLFLHSPITGFLQVTLFSIAFLISAQNSLFNGSIWFT
jgi:hypothetical protein